MSSVLISDSKLFEATLLAASHSILLRSTIYGKI